MVGYDDSEIDTAIAEQLAATSYRDSRLNAAIGSLKSREEPAALPLLIDLLETRDSKLSRRTISRAIDAIGHLGSYVDDREASREILARFLHHRSQRVKQAAIRALGQLGDPKAIPVLSKFTGLDDEDPLKKAATSAISTLKSKKPVSQNLRQLQNEVSKLQRANDQLQEKATGFLLPLPLSLLLLLQII